MLETILVILIILIMLGVIPARGARFRWPGGIVGTLLLILLILLLLDVI